ncbi:MAG: exonuclease domain-containing protein [Eubacteriales bacterium]|nr:exonuclease domain-containing protein [Eubacteriales bacterium]
MLGNKPGKQLNSYIPSYVLFDLETTGISSNYDEVIEISAIKVKDGKVVVEFSELVNPLRTIPYAASAVNGITDAMVKNAPTFAEVLPRFLEFAGDDVLVGHNIKSFDLKFIYRDAQKYLGQIPENDYVDTLRMAKKLLPELSHHRLTDLAQYYHLSTQGAHRALNDCRMNQKVFEAFGKALASQPEQATNAKTCPFCGEELRKRNGRYGAFWGCAGFPNCRYTENA